MKKQEAGLKRPDTVLLADNGAFIVVDVSTGRTERVPVVVWREDKPGHLWRYYFEFRQLNGVVKKFTKIPQKRLQHSELDGICMRIFKAQSKALEKRFNRATRFPIPEQVRKEALRVLLGSKTLSDAEGLAYVAKLTKQPEAVAAQQLVDAVGKFDTHSLEEFSRAYRNTSIPTHVTASTHPDVFFLTHWQQICEQCRTITDVHRLAEKVMGKNAPSHEAIKKRFMRWGVKPGNPARP